MATTAAAMIRLGPAKKQSTSNAGPLAPKGKEASLGGGFLVEQFNTARIVPTQNWKRTSSCTIRGSRTPFTAPNPPKARVRFVGVALVRLVKLSVRL